MYKKLSKLQIEAINSMFISKMIIRDCERRQKEHDAWMVNKWANIITWDGMIFFYVLHPNWLIPNSDYKKKTQYQRKWFAKK